MGISGEAGGAVWNIAAKFVGEEAAEGLRKFVDLFIELAERGDRVIGVMSALQVDVRGLTEAMQGQVTTYEAAIAANKLFRAGVTDSAKDLAAIGKVAHETAEALGIEDVDALERLTNVLRKGKDRQNEFTLAMVEGNTVAERQANMLAILRERAEELEEGVQTTGDRVGQMKKEWEEFLDTMAATINMSSGFQDMMSGMELAFSSATAVVGTFVQGLFLAKEQILELERLKRGQGGILGGASVSGQSEFERTRAIEAEYAARQYRATGGRGPVDQGQVAFERAQELAAQSDERMYRAAHGGRSGGGRGGETAVQRAEREAERERAIRERNQSDRDAAQARMTAANARADETIKKAGEERLSSLHRQQETELADFQGTSTELIDLRLRHIDQEQALVQRQTMAEEEKVQRLHELSIEEKNLMKQSAEDKRKIREQDLRAQYATVRAIGGIAMQAAELLGLGEAEKLMILAISEAAQAAAAFAVPGMQLVGAAHALAAAIAIKGASKVKARFGGTGGADTGVSVGGGPVGAGFGAGGGGGGGGNQTTIMNFNMPPGSIVTERAAEEFVAAALVRRADRNRPLPARTVSVAT